MHIALKAEVNSDNKLLADLLEERALNVFSDKNSSTYLLSCFLIVYTDCGTYAIQCPHEISTRFKHLLSSSGEHVDKICHRYNGSILKKNCIAHHLCSTICMTQLLYRVEGGIYQTTNEYPKLNSKRRPLVMLD